MKEVSLTLSERLAAIRILNDFKGSISTLAYLLDDVKKLAITNDEWTAAKLDKQVSKDGTETWKWDDTAPEKAVSLEKETAEYLASEIKRKDEAKELTMADGAILTLDKKLK